LGPGSACPHPQPSPTDTGVCAPTAGVSVCPPADTGSREAGEVGVTACRFPRPTPMSALRTGEGTPGVSRPLNRDDASPRFRPRQRTPSPPRSRPRTTPRFRPAASQRRHALVRPRDAARGLSAPERTAITRPRALARARRPSYLGLKFRKGTARFRAPRATVSGTWAGSRENRDHPPVVSEVRCRTRPAAYPIRLTSRGFRSG
jgi:hypothetical protein